MRRLPRKQTVKHKIIIKAVDDYFGEGCSFEKRKLKKNICLWLMGRKKGVKLTEEQKEAVEIIRNNLADRTYSESILSDLSAISPLNKKDNPPSEYSGSSQDS